MIQKKTLGNILSGSITDGFIMRIQSVIEPETIKTGKFVSIQGNEYTFFSLITNLKLEASHPEILLFPPTNPDSLLYKILKKNDMYATANLRPMVMVDRKFSRISPVKTIPHHFALVQEADEKDVSTIFGKETAEKSTFFNIGTPLDMQTPVCINLDRLTERSNGIFGKTGTGKTFLTRLVLAGLIKHEKAVCLIFDMHSEYGLQARKEDSKQSFVKGLKTLFPSKVSIFSLDPSSTQRRGAMPDVSVQIPFTAIRVDDIMALQYELNLHPTAVEAAYLISGKYKQFWLQELLDRGHNAKEFADIVGAHPESIAALYRKLKRIEKYPFFIRDTQEKDQLSVIDQMMEYIDRGINIVVEFGNYTSAFTYLLIANILTRRIHDVYTKKTEMFLGSQKKELEPQKLMIVIEEAHKFLNTLAAKQTIFGTIAREMRKYYVSLLVVDQRPSGIDDEVMSQIGTKIVAQLNDEKDIQSVLTGVSNAPTLRAVLGALDSKQQALLFGHAITMPVVVETRKYDDQFYKEIAPIQKNVRDTIDEIF